MIDVRFNEKNLYKTFDEIAKAVCEKYDGHYCYHLFISKKFHDWFNKCPTTAIGTFKTCLGRLITKKLEEKYNEGFDLIVTSLEAHRYELGGFYYELVIQGYESDDNA